MLRPSGENTTLLHSAAIIFLIILLLSTSHCLAKLPGSALTTLLGSTGEEYTHFMKGS
jgi:hypothetical protein